MGNFYSVLENDFTKNFKCGQATYLQRLCRDSCMLNAWLQRARLMFRFVSRAALLIVFIVRNFMQRRFCVPRSVIYTFGYAHYR